MFHLISPDSNKPFTIGRKEGNDLRFNDLFVSREHAIIEFSGNAWSIKSLTTNSVTKVNDEEIVEKDLCDGDIIVIGVRRLRVTIKENALSLLILDQKQEVDSFRLDNNYQTIKCKDCVKIKARLISKKNDTLNSITAEIQCGKKILLKPNETLRFDETEISIQDDNLILQKTSAGFDVRIKNLDVLVGKKRLLQDINLDLPAGEILAIIGRSGQGKSTLLKLLEGKYKKGKQSEVYIGGLDYRSKVIRKHIAIMHQEPALRKDLNVKETILHGASIAMSKSEYASSAMERFEKFVELFGLSDRKTSRVQTLSGGELRRTALATELMSNPGLIILDEPLSGLDPYNAKILCTHLKQLAFLGHTIILTTHSYEALKIANKVLVLHKGKQGFYGNLQDAYRYFKTDNPEVILSELNDETFIRWENTDVKSSINIEKKYSHVVFSKNHRKINFFHELAITLKQWSRDKGKIAALFLQPLVIGFLFSQIFSHLTSLWTVAFALILTTNWFALSLSVREIVHEKEIFRNEFRKGLSILVLLTGKILLASIASLIQTLMVYAIVSNRLSVHPSIFSTLFIFACTVFPSVCVGIFVSSLSKNAGQANAFLPLLIIPQVALAGALVPLDQMQNIGKALSTIIWSRYNQSSILNLFLERQDDLFNKILPIIIAVGFYIITAIILIQSKKAK